MSFDTWYKECDGIVSRRLGLGIDDLPDATWRDYYDDGMSPRDAIECAKEDAWGDYLQCDFVLQPWQE